MYLSNNENQWIVRRNDTTRGTNGDSTNNADEYANMGDRITKQREREFYTPPTWGETRHKGTMDVQSQDWDTTRHKAREGIETSDIMDMTGKTHNRTITKETYERDTRILTEILHPTRTGTHGDTDATLPSHTTTNDTNTEYQERAEHLTNAMQVTKQGIAKLEHGILELRTLIDHFKEYIGEKVKQGLGGEQQQQTTQEIQSAPTTTQATAPRRWRM